jgi:hypothetical protein
VAAVLKQLKGETRAMSRVVRNPRGQSRPSSKAAETAMHHGGVVSAPGPFDRVDEEKVSALVQAFNRSIKDGIRALENGASEFAKDVEPMPGACVEAFDICDVHTGEHVMVWRVATRKRSKHAIDRLDSAP